MKKQIKISLILQRVNLLNEKIKEMNLKIKNDK